MDTLTQKKNIPSLAFPSDFLSKDLSIKNKDRYIDNVILRLVPEDYTSYIWTDGTPFDLQLFNTFWRPGEPDNGKTITEMWKERVNGEWRFLMHAVQIDFERESHICKFSCPNN